jgi:hypothetical protein
VIDLLGAIEITVAAAAVIATIAITLGDTHTHRLRIALVLGGWFALLAALTATGIFERYVPAGLAATIGSILVFGGGALFSTGLRARLAAVPVSTLVAINVVRFLGLNFLVLHGAGRLPATFALFAGWGDVAMAGSALLVALMMRQGETTTRTLVLLWNGVGLLELTVAFTLGVTSAPGPLQLLHAEPSTAMLRSLPWFLIPGYLLPLIVIAHLAIFWKLWR